MGYIFEGHYYSALRLFPNEIKLRRQKETFAKGTKTVTEKSETLSLFLNDDWGKYNVKTFKCEINVKGMQSIFVGSEVPILDPQVIIDGESSWRLLLPSDPRFNGISGIIHGIVGDEDILICDQVTMSTPKQHVKKPNDPGWFLLSNELRTNNKSKSTKAMDSEEENDKRSLVVYKDDKDKRDQIKDDYFGQLWKQYAVLLNDEGKRLRRHVFWKWTTPPRSKIDYISSDLTPLGLNQFHGGPLDKMTTSYLSKKK